jgi:hypothetical protein
VICSVPSLALAALTTEASARSVTIRRFDWCEPFPAVLKGSVDHHSVDVVEGTGFEWRSNDRAVVDQCRVLLARSVVLCVDAVVSGLLFTWFVALRLPVTSFTTARRR